MSHTPGRSPYERHPVLTQISGKAVDVDWEGKGLVLRVTHIRRFRIWQVVPVESPTWWHHDWLLVLLRGAPRQARYYVYDDQANEIKSGEEVAAKARRAVTFALFHLGGAPIRQVGYREPHRPWQ
ncbi:hypothetical protein [Jongsikchunia kroppenstedtii]|uniref:hypothetical protein n=1 Tax=Jongsikchunia kroppenstedtii TaxID=1121721 RepID=UPI0003679349|nr:hypothetical protein [Jongsikchunia kroppenstedtii]